jgi:ketosteroid isomerase-like protein
MLNDLRGPEFSVFAVLLLALGLEATIGFPSHSQAEAPLHINRPASVQFAQATPSTTITASETDAIKNVLGGYYDAFGRDSAAAAAFFGEPIVIVQRNQVIILNTRAELAASFDATTANRKALGYSHSKFDDYRVKLLNPTTALVGLVAILIKTDGSEMQRLGWTYLLRMGNAGWKIQEIIATDLDKLISSD